MSDLPQYQEPWWELYKGAILETDRRNLEDRIKDAEEAIAKRSLGAGVPPNERVALDDARVGLSVLRQEHRDSLRRGQ